MSLKIKTAAGMAKKKEFEVCQTADLEKVYRYLIHQIGIKQAQKAIQLIKLEFENLATRKEVYVTGEIYRDVASLEVSWEGPEFNFVERVFEKKIEIINGVKEKDWGENGLLIIAQLYENGTINTIDSSYVRGMNVLKYERWLPETNLNEKRLLRFTFNCSNREFATAYYSYLIDLQKKAEEDGCGDYTHHVLDFTLTELVRNAILHTQERKMKVVVETRESIVRVRCNQDLIYTSRGKGYCLPQFLRSVGM